MSTKFKTGDVTPVKNSEPKVTLSDELRDLIAKNWKALDEQSRIDAIYLREMPDIIWQSIRKRFLKDAEDQMFSFSWDGSFFQVVSDVDLCKQIKSPTFFSDGEQYTYIGYNAILFDAIIKKVFIIAKNNGAKIKDIPETESHKLVIKFDLSTF